MYSNIENLSLGMLVLELKKEKNSFIYKVVSKIIIKLIKCIYYR